MFTEIEVEGTIRIANDLLQWNGDRAGATVSEGYGFSLEIGNGHAPPAIAAALRAQRYALWRHGPSPGFWQQVEGDPFDEFNRFWAAAAAAGWPGPRVQEFLRDCAASPRADVASAAVSSLQGKYQTYTPL
ncbi:MULTISPECIES: hypothetical protein [unclassified Kitasatospora]|uniref:hypothetical protein n=1 Tax=unclassified Kitasatospora TaxID=2633591 RepID=UPI0033E0BA9D